MGRNIGVMIIENWIQKNKPFLNPKEDPKYQL